MQKAFEKLLPFVLRNFLPALLGSLGTVAAVAWSDGFRAFCGF